MRPTVSPDSAVRRNARRWLPATAALLLATQVGIFDDVPTDYWAAAWIEQLFDEGITAGCGDDNYCPEDPVTRDQMAVFIVRTFELGD